MGKRLKMDLFSGVAGFDFAIVLSMESQSRQVEFEGHDGLMLRGVLHHPVTEERSALVLCHCFTCSKDFKIINWLSRHLASLGYAVLRFDFAGLNASEGSFEQTNLSTNIEDLMYAVEWLSNQGLFVRALIGHSMGGTAAILSASQLPAVESVVVMGTSSELSGLKRLLSSEHKKRLRSRGRTRVQIGGKSVTLNQEFFDDLHRHSILDTVAEWGKSLLVIHGADDRVVPIDSGEKLFRKANHPKSFMAIRGAGHLFSEDKHKAEEISRVIAGWIQLNGKTS